MTCTSIALGASLFGNVQHWESFPRIPKTRGLGKSRGAHPQPALNPGSEVQDAKGTRRSAGKQRPQQPQVRLPSHGHHQPRQRQAITFQLEIARAQGLSWGAEH